MDDENLMEPRRGPLGFLKSLVHRFLYGDTPMSGNLRHFDNPNFRDLEFDLHPGPLKDALVDSRTLGKLLFIYIYCIDNPVSVKTDELWKNPTISAKIASDFIFYPTSVTSADGYSIAVGTSFTDIPMFFIVNPSGNSLQECKVVSSGHGSITAESLIMTLSSSADRAPVPAPIAEPLIGEQNEPGREQTATSPAETPELDQARVDELFAQLPEIETGTENSCVIKFRFDNGSEKMKVFYKNASISSMFTFVRHFAFPRQFLLFAPGCPMVKLEECEASIESLHYGNSFVVVVIYED